MLHFWKYVPPWHYLRWGKIRLFRTVWPYTMVSYRRLNNAYTLVQNAVQKGISGAIAECGVWRGGCSGVMARAAVDAGDPRKMWLFDSFEGLPEPGALDGKKAEGYKGRCFGPREDVEELLFEKLRLLPSQVELVQGWFQDTLPHKAESVGPIAVLRLDGDWYESTLCCLNHLYDQVVEGGYVIIDDYGHWEGCKKAVQEFFVSRGEPEPLLTKIDNTGVFFCKK